MGGNSASHDEILKRIKAAVGTEQIRVSRHARKEMTGEGIILDDVLNAMGSARILENYPEHRRGACCLLCGQTSDGCHLHVVCTTGHPVIIIITVYVPKPPKWVTPTHRRPQP